jgi:uncharacterized membrane protein YtjA (UPF0391 family)
VQLIAAQILGRGGVGSSTEKVGQVLDVTNIILLVVSTNLRTVMSSIMRRRNGLMAALVMGVLLS